MYDYNKLFLDFLQYKHYLGIEFYLKFPFEKHWEFSLKKTFINNLYFVIVLLNIINKKITILSRARRVHFTLY